MAKSTKGKGGKAQQPVNAEEIVQDASEAIAEDVTEIVEDAEVLSDDAPVETSEPDDATEEASVDDIAEPETPVEPEAPTPEVIRETVVERKGGFVPLVLGGVVAAGIGVASAGYIFPNGLPFGPQATDYSSAIEAQSSRIDALSEELAAKPAFDPSALEVAVADASNAVSTAQEQIEGLSETVGTFEERLTTLEALPRQDGSGVSQQMENALKEMRAELDQQNAALEQMAPVENELNDMRAALDLQKGELATMIAEAQATKQDAEKTARDTLARAGVTRILVALESGAPFADALAEVEANSDAAVPEALAQTAADGVPTLAALSESYPIAAREALAAVRSEDTGGGVSSFLTRQLGVRSVTPREGDDPDAVLSRVGAAVDEGRIADALAIADALPEGAKAPLADWMTQANLRLSAAREAQALATSLNSQ
ncbi:COG4223 family protein [Planktotalea sp.]|uniref:COG4223 family protein n=1 Tax=Planktotalea sp. TaxID=2029877 RepID=UPI003F6DA3FF